MKYIKLVVAVCLSIILHTTYPHFVTYELNPGRLGDHLLTYSKALLVQYLAEKEGRNIPLYHRPFKWSDQLTLSTVEQYIPPKRYETVPVIYYDKNTIAFTSSSPKTKQKPTGYVCSLKTIIYDIRGFTDLYRYTQKTPEFKKRLLEMISPVNPIESIDLPDNMPTVAIHVRTGGGFDKPLFMQSNLPSKPSGNHSFADLIYPLRFPPEIFYIEQLSEISRLYEFKPLFIHIFTDDPDPAAIVDRFKEKLKDFKLTFSYRTAANSHNTNVLEDLFNMTRFDCLIRPASSYSKIAQLLGNHTIIMYPNRSRWIDNKLIIEKVSTINNRQQKNKRHRK